MSIRSGIRNWTAGAALVAALSLGGATLAGATPSKDEQTVTLHAAVCPSWDVVPANESPAEWDETGHSGELNTAADVSLADEGDIPKACDEGKGFGFAIRGENVRNVSVNSSSSFALSASEQKVVQDDGLWVSTWMPEGVKFAGLRCYDDVAYSDSLERIVATPDVKKIECVAFGVSVPISQDITLLAVTCESWALVPANDKPSEWDETGHGGELDTSADTSLADPSDIPAKCDKGENFVFSLTRASDGAAIQSENVSSSHGKTITLRDKGFAALSEGGIFVRVTPKEGYAFAGLRCYDDNIFSDNLEQIYVPASELGKGTIYCIGFGVKTKK